MEPEAALARLTKLLEGQLPEGRLELDDHGGLILVVRRDMLHLDADALNDRLAAWAARELSRTLPHASAFVSFRHARPATQDDAELDLQEAWRGLEPTLRLEVERPPPSEEDLARLARAVPAFFRLLAADGRPEGWRRVDEGVPE